MSRLGRLHGIERLLTEALQGADAMKETLLAAWISQARAIVVDLVVKAEDRCSREHEN